MYTSTCSHCVRYNVHMIALIMYFFYIADKKRSSDNSLKVLPLCTESNSGIQPASVTADVKPKKKIILVRKKSVKTSEKPSMKPTGDQKPPGTVSTEEKEMLGIQNGKLEQIAAEDKRPDLEDRREVKRRKLLQTSNDGAVASRSVAALPASTQKKERPPVVDMVCIERSVPLEDERMAAATEQADEPGTNEDSQDTTDKDSGKILQRLSSGKKITHTPANLRRPCTVSFPDAWPGNEARYMLGLCLDPLRG